MGGDEPPTYIDRVDAQENEKGPKKSRNLSVLYTEETPAWKFKALQIVDGSLISSFMTIVTIWALFGDDIRLLATWKESDDVFVGLTIFCLVCFTLEATLFSILKPDYFLGFYFWMDGVATLSLLFDIPEVLSAIKGAFGQEDEAPSTEDLSLDTDSVVSSGSGALGDSTTLTRASRTSRAGSKAGRIVRLVRLIRILKLYKQYSMGQKGEEEVETTESKVGKKLSDLTTRRVIIGVLLMLFCLQLFDADTFLEYSIIQDGGLEMLVETHNAAGRDSPAFRKCMDAYVKTSGAVADSDLYWLNIEGIDYSAEFELEGGAHRALREGEYLSFQFMNSFAKFDIREQSEMQAMLNIFKTIFVCFILGIGAMCFSSDANNLVLAPIERMFARVREMAKNPLAASAKPKARSANDLESPRVVVDPDSREERGKQEYETKILEDAFKKVCSLMAVGFGEAGAEIIAENIAGGGDLDPMIPGKKMVAIFGFCDIRQFTDATEILQEGVMEFVNSIAQIVHMEVALHGGSANKNIGDAFLLVWKFPKEVTPDDIKEGCNRGHYSGVRSEDVQDTADKALATFVVICAMLKKSARLRAYGDNQALCDRIPNYRVKMGFGLHVGWAIEGAIGSVYKVDASYLSPNVNMAARLEAATKQFGVPFLLSEDFISILSSGVSQRCRQIDRVTVKGSTQPMGLYTYDIDVDEYEVDTNNHAYSLDPIEFTHSNRSYNDEFSDHPDIVDLSAATPEYLAKFGDGFLSYKQGDWKTAKQILTKLEFARKSANGNVIKDGPCRTLLDVMAEYDYQAPDGWPGFRELTEK